MTFEPIPDEGDQSVFDVPLPDGRVATVAVTRLVFVNRPCVQVRIDQITAASSAAKA